MHKALIVSTPKGNCLAGKAVGRQREAGGGRASKVLGESTSSMLSQPEIKPRSRGDLT